MTSLVLVAALAGLSALASAEVDRQALPTGQYLTPLAAPGASFEKLTAHIGPYPDYVADGAAAIAVSPDGREMLVLTSGFNLFAGSDSKLVPEQSVQYIFRYRIDARAGRLVQTLTVRNSYSGIAWQPDGRGFIVGGGVDDVLHIFTRGAKGFVATAPIALGHAAGIGADVKPQAAGVAVSHDGSHALVANYYNDSVSLVDLKTRAVIAEQDLRPGKIDPAKSGVAGGENPFALVWRDATHAYVSAARDREIVALTIAPQAITVSSRIATIGEPTALLIDRATGRLYATEDNADRLAIVDMRRDALVGEPRIALPEAMGGTALGKGTNPNGLARLPDGRLLVTMGGINALAVVATGERDASVQALIPTGWYPSSVATSRDGARIFVANRKSVPGPNPEGCPPKLAVVKAQPSGCGAANQYVFQLEKAGLLQFPMPAARTLVATTQQVADNIGIPLTAARAAAEAKLAMVRARIKHVIFIVKENRTYDQLLGDLEVGNGDPKLAILGAPLSPNHHQLARQFVTLDNFYASGEQSSTGWTWTTAGRAPDLLEKTAPVNYAQRGLAYEAEEEDRNIPTALSPAERHALNPNAPADPDVLPGPALLTAPDPDDDHEPGQGFLWNAAIRAGLSLRNYGFADSSVYTTGAPGAVLPVREPARTGQRIYTSADRLLATRSDPYFRGFDLKLPDFWRVREWQREFDQQDAAGTLPQLTLLRLSNDHFGDFEQAIDGVNTVEAQMADNDYAIGQVIERVAHSRVSGSTLIFVIEDDAQNGVDHVDARRSAAFVIGPYVRQHAVVSTRYNTVSLLRTIEAVLGLEPLGLNDALALPMADVFDTDVTQWDYRARAASVLRATQLPIPADRFEPAPAAGLSRPVRSSAYWAEAMRGQDFGTEDRLDTDAFNAALWRGLGEGPEPKRGNSAER